MRAAFDTWLRRRLVLGPALLLLAPGASAGQDQARMEQTAAILTDLVEHYGVSGDEGRVRQAIVRYLPDWAIPRVDSAGNLWVHVGRGDPVVVFVAHMDETGFQVDSILGDGTLALSPRGGFLPWLWEATPAMVHTPQGAVAGVFMPRDTVGASPPRSPPQGLRVDVGGDSRAATEALGVAVGQMVTNPKKFVRLAGARVTARSFDDRVGSTAQILALRALDPAKLGHEVVFLWVTREEIGLVGASRAARELGTRAVRVHAVDTFVSADGPHDLRSFAAQPLGNGPVARAVDNSSVTPPAVVDTLRALAARHGIALQVGTTNGGNDGAAFAPWGVVDVPIGWPLRYSHSPVEVIDLRDVVALGDLVRVIAEDW